MLYIDLTFIVQLILFGLFFALLNVLFYRPLSAVFRERTARIEAGQRAADEARRRAEETQREVQRLLEQARVQAQGVIAAVNKEAGAQRHTLLEQAQQRADVLVQEALAAIRTERQAAIEQLRREITPIAILVASKVVGKSLDTSANRDIADRVIAEAGGVR